MDLEVFRNLGLAFALGFLVGLQRQFASTKLAGIRTFPLITALGAMCALFLEYEGGVWVIGIGLLSVMALFGLGNWMRMQGDESDPGVTTEFAGLVMFLVGALVMSGHEAVGVVTAGIVSVLLHWKQPLHQLVKRFGEDDFSAVVRLIIIGMVILPVLPDQVYGPYHVINPYKIWLMVVLIVGISMSAYIASRLLGAKAGTLLAGIFGGLISSTATTVSYARRSRTHAEESKAASIVIMLASTVVFGRVLIEIMIVAAEIMPTVGPPLAIMMGFMAFVSLGAYLMSRSKLAVPEVDDPPKDLKAAVVFGLLYAAVLLGIAAAKENFGDTGLYVVAGLSGMTDMDAITLSTAQLMKAGTLETSTGWRLIMVGALANLVFKSAAIAILGAPRLLARIVVMFGLSLMAGVLLLLFWPG